MTDERMAFLELLRNGGGGDFLKDLAETMLQRLMEWDVEGQIGAGRYERNDGRTTHRNGYRERDLETRLGTLELKIPKLRRGSYFPAFLEPRKTAERALVAVIQEAWIQGVSTRKVDELVQAMGYERHLQEPGIDAVQGHRHTGRRFPQPADRGRMALSLARRPPISRCATRTAAPVVSIAAIIATGVNRDGRREILGLGLGPSEAATFWLGFLRTLQQRGLAGVKLVISDAHEGLKAAIRQVFSASWQRCRVHFMRNALAHAPKGQHSMVSAAIRTAFAQETPAAASAAWRHVADQLRTRFPKLATLMDEAETEVLAYKAFPAAHWAKIHSTNPIERLNKEVKRRADVVGIFPNEASIIRLVGAILLEQNDEWQLQHRYMTLETITGMADDLSLNLPAAITNAASPGGNATAQ